MDTLYFLKILKTFLKKFLDYCMIFFDNVSKAYSKDMVALESVTFKVLPREFVSIVGQSGAGKTTILKLLIAEERPTAGRIYFEDKDIHQLSDSELPMLRRRIGSVFQEIRLLSNKTAFENVAFAAEVAGRTDEELASDVPQVLELVGLSNKLNNFPHELSGGEKQRVAIARALVHRPDIIMADEPTGNLDPINTWEIIKLLIKINELGTTVLLATHDKEIVNTIGKRVISLDHGHLIRDEKEGKYVL